MRSTYQKALLFIVSCFVPLMAIGDVQSISLSCQSDSTGTGGTCQVTGTPLGNLQKIAWVGQNVNMQITSATQVSYQCWTGLPNTGMTLSSVTVNAINKDAVPITAASATVLLSCSFGV